MSGFDGDKANALLGQIAQLVVNDPKISGRPWVSLAVVSIIEPGSRQLSAYSYDATNKGTPALPENRDIDELFLALHQATTVEGKAPWKSALLQIRREGMRFGIDFEYENALRWKISPDGMLALIESLRPK